MGYDMYIENLPEELALAKVEHEAYWANYEANKDKPIPPDPGYFRLNIFGMGTYRQFMEQFGMLATHYDFKWGDADVDAAIAGEEPGIPIHKLGSNDGWLVRPEEITSALVPYDHLDRRSISLVVGDHLDYWDKWIEFLRLAASCGGFRVH